MKKILSVILALAMMMTSVLALADASYTGKADSQIGGVDAVTCKTCIENGANVLVAGSAVYKAENIPERIAQLRG